MDTTEFKKILYSTIVSAGIDEAEQAKRTEPLISFIRDRIPSKLYKYRSFCDNHIDAFYKDQVWVSTAQSMNDGFDTRLYFDKEASVNIYMSQTASDKVVTFIEMIKSDEAFKEEVSKLPGADTALQYLDLPESFIKQGIEDSRNKLASIITTMLENIPAVTQQTLKFCCFSETVTSASMWGQYSNNESGFCLEYDFNDSGNTYFTPEGISVSTSLFPIIYGKDRYQVHAAFINYLMQYKMFYENAITSGSYASLEAVRAHIDSVLKCPDIFISTKIALHKSLEWQFEKEWRLFCNAVDNTNPKQAPSGCIIKRPKAVYLGRRVSEVNEKIIRVLAQEKDIPVFKMALDDNSPTYELIYQ